MSNDHSVMYSRTESWVRDLLQIEADRKGVPLARIVETALRDWVVQHLVPGLAKRSSQSSQSSAAGQGPGEAPQSSGASVRDDRVAQTSHGGRS